MSWAGAQLMGRDGDVAAGWQADQQTAAAVRGDDLGVLSLSLTVPLELVTVLAQVGAVQCRAVARGQRPRGLDCGGPTGPGPCGRRTRWPACASSLTAPRSSPPTASKGWAARVGGPGAGAAGVPGVEALPRGPSPSNRLEALTVWPKGDTYGCKSAVPKFVTRSWDS